MSENGTAVVLPRPLVEHSESLAQLAAALAVAQGELSNAPAKAPSNYGNYADMAAVLDVARPILSKHGLSVVQFPSAEGKRVSVTSLLLHKSGEWLRGELSVDARDSGPQSVGSAITYCRRYSYMAAVGIAPEDDDGEAAQPTRERPIGERERPVGSESRSASPVASPLSPHELQALADHLDRAGVKPSQVSRKYGVGSLRELSRAQYAEALARAKSLPDRESSPRTAEPVTEGV